MSFLRNPQYDVVKLFFLAVTIIALGVFIVFNINNRNNFNSALVGDTLAPSIPTGLTVESTTSSSVTLSWDPSTGDVANYTVYQITDDGDVPGDGIMINVSTAPGTPIAKDIYGVAVNNLGRDYVEFGTNPLWNSMLDEIGFTSAAYTAGAEDRWIHPVSATGGFDSGREFSVLAAPVGMGANIDEIFYHTQKTTGAYNLQKKNNDTNVDFWDVTADYIKNHNQKMVFTANVIRGTTEEMGTFINSIGTHGISKYKLRYGQEVPSGEGGSLTSNEYIAKLNEFDAYLNSHYGSLPERVVNMADHTTCPNTNQTNCWDNNAVYQWALAHDVEEFSQYFWLDGIQATADTQFKNIDDYFAQSNTLLQTSLNNDVLVRLTQYQDDMPNLKMHLGQYGMSLQRSGYAAHTMLHGVMLWNLLFEILKFNSEHNNFVNSAIFLENETAVSPYGAGDSSFTIDPSFIQTSGSKSFVKRVPGVAYEMLKPVFTSANPLFVQTEITNRATGLDAIAVKSDKTRLYIYNNGPEKTISGLTLNSAPITGSHYRNALWSEKLYGSIGSSPAYSTFKDEDHIEANPNLQAIPAQAEKGNIDLGNPITIRPYSITVIDLE
ncbi:hypothetical protein IPF86_01950 [Candidatus Nomurabacteria bacterium]|nr:MAG: hypothetical protein IPF86_01950 [Candidatus Nomurabacteria bacterium]